HLIAHSISDLLEVRCHAGDIASLLAQLAPGELGTERLHQVSGLVRGVKAFAKVRVHLRRSSAELGQRMAKDSLGSPQRIFVESIPSRGACNALRKFSCLLDSSRPQIEF